MAFTNSLALAPSEAWFKSSYSGGNGNSCVEIADLGTSIGVRDSKQDNGPAFVISPKSFAAFLTGLNEGNLTD